MERISITIDANKIPKDKVQERRFTNGQGQEIVARELKLEVVPVREPKVVKEGPTWQMVKTHFVGLAQTKEERTAKAKSVIVGDGITFRDLKPRESVVAVPANDREDIRPEDVPF